MAVKTVSKLDELDVILAEESRGQNYCSTGCAVGRWIAEQTKSDQVRLKELMADRSQGNAVLRRVLKRLGLEVSEATLRRHRNKVAGGEGCSCGKAGLLWGRL